MREFLGKFVIAYINYILIYSSDLQSHVTHVHLVLERLHKNQLYVKGEKFEFHVTTFLRYVIEQEGVAMDQDKVKAGTTWSTLVNIKDVQRLRLYLIPLDGLPTAF